MTIPTVQQDDQNNNKEIDPKVGIWNLGGNYGLECFNLFFGLPLEAEGASFSPRLSIATAVIGSVLQMQHQCPADPQAYPVYS